MSTIKKLNVVAVFLLGAMSFCAAIVRMVFNIQIVNAGLAKKTDVNMGLTTLMYWSMVEAGLSLIAANLPSVYSLFSQNEFLQSKMNSLRSKLSLRSFRSTDKLRGSERSGGNNKPYEHMEGWSSSDGSTMKEEKYSESYTYAGHEMGGTSVRSDIEAQRLGGRGGSAV